MRVLALIPAAFAAALTPGAEPGIGVAVLALGVLLFATWRQPRSRWLWVYCTLAVLLAAVPAVRDNNVVVTLSLLGVLTLATLALCGVHGFVWLQPLNAIPKAAAVANHPVPHAEAVGRVGLVTLAVVVPFIILFAWADAAFASLVDTPSLATAETGFARGIQATIVFVGALTLRLAPHIPVNRNLPARPRLLVPIEWIPALGGLVLVFMIFVAVQARVLFGGDAYVRETTGVTYAEYARSGYWQLLAVGALTLLVVGATERLTSAGTPALRRLRAALLGSLTVLTLVVLASAFHRLELYQDAFGATPLRLYGEAGLIFLGSVFGLVLAAGGIGAVRARLPQLCVALAGVAVLALAISNPDARVAQHNIDRWHETGKIDIATLGRLSADAVPELDRLPVYLRNPAFASIGTTTETDGTLGWNLARARARTIVNKLRPEVALTAPTAAPVVVRDGGAERRAAAAPHHRPKA